MTYSSEIEEFQVPKAKHDLYQECRDAWESTRKEIGKLSDNDIINNSTKLQKLLEDYEMYRTGIDSFYDDLVTYVAMAKKDFEEEMKS